MLRSMKWILLTLFVSQIVCRDIDYCYVDNDQPYLQMASKTAYHFVHGGNGGYKTIPNCRPVQIWMLSRHGTRYPTRPILTTLMTLVNLRNQIVYNHESRNNGHLCNSDLDNLKRWSLDSRVTYEVAAELAPQGFEDMNLHARRMRSTFPELFPPNVRSVDSATYKFRSTEKQRTKASMEAFMTGLFNRNDIPTEKPTGNDTLLTLNKYCTTWINDVENNPDTLVEQNKFGAGPEFQNLILNVSRRLGFLFNISIGSVNIMYDMCRFDKAWKVVDVSPWCAVFTEEELKILEYQEDLFYYYNFGYGNKLNSQLGCPPMRDMFEHFKKLESGDYSNEPKGVYYFTHSATLQPFMTAMRFAEDPYPLMASNYNTSGRRQWRISKIGPFAGNVVAVFYKCDTGAQNKVMFYADEKPVLYEGCQVGLCDWEYLKNKLGDAAFGCNLDFCGGNGAISSHGLSTVLVMMAIPSLVYWSHVW